jgi:hypothetical protein
MSIKSTFLPLWPSSRVLKTILLDQNVSHIFSHRTLYLKIYIYLLVAIFMRSTVFDNLAEALKNYSDISEEDIAGIVNSGDVKQYNQLLYQIMLRTTNKATNLWRRVVVHGGMTVHNFQRLLDLILKFENSSKECKVRTEFPVFRMSIILLMQIMFFR